MILRRLTIIITFLTAWVWSNGQQINAVPDYVFRNQMSVGRNAVTDTAAYFSIGPRYGANKGLMPPIVVDTAIFSSGKRNGLLIFSVQKNKFLYWDSVRVQWSDMAGSSGSYIVAGDTASMLTPYVRHAGYGLTKSGQSFLVDTLNIATRAWRQKGDDSVLSISVLLTGNQTIAGNKTFTNDVNFNGTPNTNSVNIRNGLTGYNHILYSKANAVNQFIYLPSDTGTILTDKTLQSFVSGTTNYIPKFTAASTIGNSQIFDNGTNVGIGTASPLSKLQVSGETVIANGSPTSTENGLHLFFDTNVGYITSEQPGTTFRELRVQGSPLILQTAGTERLRITSAGELLINTTTDAGDYKLQVSGNIYNTGSITTGAPSGGSIKPWKIGEAATVSPTSPNRTIRVEIDGTVYYLHAKTTND